MKFLKHIDEAVSKDYYITLSTNKSVEINRDSYNRINDLPAWVEITKSEMSSIIDELSKAKTTKSFGIEKFQGGHYEKYKLIWISHSNRTTFAHLFKDEDEYFYLYTGHSTTYKCDQLEGLLYLINDKIKFMFLS